VPPREILEEKLYAAITLARSRPSAALPHDLDAE